MRVAPRVNKTPIARPIGKPLLPIGEVDFSDFLLGAAIPDDGSGGLTRLLLAIATGFGSYASTA